MHRTRCYSRRSFLLGVGKSICHYQPEATRFKTSDGGNHTSCCIILKLRAIRNTLNSHISYDSQQQNPINSLNINPLFVTTGTGCVLCEVWGVSLKDGLPQSRRNVDLFLRWDPVWSRASPSQSCGEQCCNGSKYRPSTSVFPVSIIPPTLHIHIHLGTLRIRTRWRRMGICKRFNARADNEQQLSEQ